MENTKKIKRNSSSKDDRNVRGRPSPTSFAAVRSNMLPLEPNPGRFSHELPPVGKSMSLPSLNLSIPPMKNTSLTSSLSPMVLSTPKQNILSVRPPLPPLTPFTFTTTEPPTTNPPSANTNSLLKSRLLKRIRHAREEITHDIEQLEKQEQEIKKKGEDVENELKEIKGEDDQKKIQEILVNRFRALNAELRQVSHETKSSRKDMIGLIIEKNRLHEILIECVKQRDEAEKKLEVWNDQLKKLNSESKKSISAEKREKIKDLEGKITGAVDNLKAVMKKMDEETIFFHSRQLDFVLENIKKLTDKREELTAKYLQLRKKRDPLARKVMSQSLGRLERKLRQYDDEKSGGRKTRKIKKRTTRSNKSRVYTSRTPKVRTSALFK